MDTNAIELAQRVVEQLAARGEKLVLAESCTGGQAAALLATIPGVSAHWCGSLVTYREASKQEWLGIDPQWIERYTAESAEVTTAMATGALQTTPEATWSAAITGHLGPDAPRDRDGIVFTAVGKRDGDGPGANLRAKATYSAGAPATNTLRHVLQTAHRRERIEEAATVLLGHLLMRLQGSGS